jgi:hypothetical protein
MTKAVREIINTIGDIITNKFTTNESSNRTNTVTSSLYDFAHKHFGSLVMQAMFYRKNWEKIFENTRFALSLYFRFMILKAKRNHFIQDSNYMFFCDYFYLIIR